MIKLFCDAAVSGNPGPTAVGWVCYADKNQFQMGKNLKNQYSNHEAEFISVYEALKWVRSHCDSHDIIAVYSDSKIVVQVLSRRFSRNKIYSDYLKLISPLLDQYTLSLVEWVPESQNKKADQLAKSYLRT
ncbi:ribonuclease HI family protein [Bavariicoccus seileri]|uniref:ribonuclease HI family protein n=1 Tax=Bavariicoccus seileri TaxID=549685 RepID=UPI0003B5F5BB|nr:ribonuclease HI family protein [Bavariicoccus seileri]